MFIDRIKNGLFLENRSLVAFYPITVKIDENQNGPYGPQEPLLQDRFENLGFTNGILGKNSNFRGVGKQENLD